MSCRLLLSLVIALGAALSLAPNAHAQVSVAPTALFLNDQERFGALYVGNASTTAQEVTIGFRFGYTAADSTGGVYVNYADTSAASQYSAAPYIRAFPQRFVLPPGESQVVRLTARPPSDFENGWLWSRVLTTATPQVPFQDTTSTGVQANIVFRIQQVTALFYTKGEATASVAVEDMLARVDSNEVAIFADIDKTGNRPFLGTAVMRLKDGSGGTVSESRTSFAVYVPEQRRFAVPLPEDATAPSDLTAELTITSERTDIPSAHILDLEPVVKSVAVTAR